MSRCLLLLSLLFLPLPSLWAGKVLFLKVDSLLYQRFFSPKFDTLYACRPPYRWKIKLKDNLNFTGLDLKGNYNDKTYKLNLRTNLKTSISASFSYLGYGFGFSFNPALLRGDLDDWQADFTISGSKWGIDFSLQQAKTFQGDFTQGNYTCHFNEESVNETALTLSGYYILNNRRYCYPAAFTQSFVQKRSAGSWQIGACYLFNSVDFDHSRSDTVPLPIADIHLSRLGIGPGYGYNYVPNSHWLLHLSGVCHFMFFTDNWMHFNDDFQHINYSFPEFILVSRAAVIYNYNRWFMGTRAVYYYAMTGSEDAIEVNTSRLKTQFILGVRI